MVQSGQKRQFQKELDTLTKALEEEGRRPRLLLHSCCAPCSSYVLEYLSQYFEVTVYYYNPNIFPPEEYDARMKEQQRLIREMELSGQVGFEAGEYKPEDFYAIARGREREAEGGERCLACYKLRLGHVALKAAEGGYDYFTTTLSISPLKKAETLNEIGCEIAGIWGVPYLVSDFKKKNGYKRSVELSVEYGLYRQNYCGCVYSREEALRRESRAQKSQDLA